MNTNFNLSQKLDAVQLLECIEKQRSGRGGIGGFTRAKSCGKEGIGFEGFIFVRGSAGVGVGVEFEVEYEIHLDDPLSLDHLNFSGGVGWVGYGASIQFGGGGRGFYKGPIPGIN